MSMVGVVALAPAAAAVVAVLLAAGADAEPGWGAAQPAPTRDAGRVDAAVRPDGSAIAVWTERRAGRTTILASERPAGAGWSAPATVLAPQPRDVRGLDVTAAGDGGALVAFTYLARHREVLPATRRSTGGVWEEPRALAPEGGLHAFGTALGDGGAATVAWAEGGLPGTALSAAWAAPGGAWAGGVVAPTAWTPTDPVVAAGPDGRAAVAALASPAPGAVLLGAGSAPSVLWSRGVARDPRHRADLAVARPLDDGLWAAGGVVTDDPVAGWPLAVGGSAERPVAVWAQFTRPDGGPVRVLAAERDG